PRRPRLPGLQRRVGPDRRAGRMDPHRRHPDDLRPPDRAVEHRDAHDPEPRGLGPGPAPRLRMSEEGGGLMTVTETEVASPPVYRLAPRAEHRPGGAGG